MAPDCSITYADLELMDMDDLAEANAALDLKIDAEKKASQDSQRKMRLKRGGKR